MSKRTAFLFTALLLLAFPPAVSDSGDIKIETECIAAFKGADTTLSRDRVVLKPGRKGVLKKELAVSDPGTDKKIGIKFLMEVVPYRTGENFTLDVKSSSVLTTAGGFRVDNPGKIIKREDSMEIYPGSSGLFELMSVPELKCSVIVILNPSVIYGEEPKTVEEILSLPTEEVLFYLEVGIIRPGEEKEILEKPLLRTYMEKPVDYRYELSVPRETEEGMVLDKESILLDVTPVEQYEKKLFFRMNGTGKMVYPPGEPEDYYFSRRDEFRLGDGEETTVEYLADEERTMGFTIKITPSF